MIRPTMVRRGDSRFNLVRFLFIDLLQDDFHLSGQLRSGATDCLVPPVLPQRQGRPCTTSANPHRRYIYRSGSAEHNRMSSSKRPRGREPALSDTERSEVNRRDLARRTEFPPIIALLLKPTIKNQQPTRSEERRVG